VFGIIVPIKEKLINYMIQSLEILWKQEGSWYSVFHSCVLHWRGWERSYVCAGESHQRILSGQV